MTGAASGSDAEAVAVLRDGAIEDIDRVAAEAARAISGLLTKHDRDVERIAEKYQLKHKLTAIAGWALHAGPIS